MHERRGAKNPKLSTPRGVHHDRGSQALPIPALMPCDAPVTMATCPVTGIAMLLEV
jgi:hypothetical protein